MPKSIFNINNVIKLTECHSTNDVINALLKERKGKHGTVVITESQKKGKGQRGNHWESEPYKNLTFSLLLFPQLKIPDQYYLNYYVSVSLLTIMKETTNNNGFFIKWPNDLLFGKNKIAGILIENTLCDSLVESSIVGIGLNVNQTSFTVQGATSLKLITNQDHNVFNLLKRILYQFETNYRLLFDDKQQLKQTYMNNLFGFKESLLFRDKKGLFQGTIVDVDDTGNLLVDKNGNIKKYDIKEIEFIR
ncbi:MAG TPA: biotin--[acetyl-CoA-carboxylase] ligase [Cyclobacteriaceae bacterium]